MKTVVILSLLCLSIYAFNLERQEEIVEKVNKLKTTWKATVYPRDIKTLIGVLPNGPKLPEKVFENSNDELPESYDSRTAHPECDSIGEIRDQSKCGSCWAFGASEVMTDRLCLHSGGQIHTRLSPLHLVSCCTSCGFGCHGGTPAGAFLWWRDHGVPSGGLYGDKTTCKPYFLPECEDHMQKCHDYADTPKCENSCIPEYQKTVEEDLTFGKNAYSVNGEKNIMKEIMENGPVEGAFKFYNIFK